MIVSWSSICIDFRFKVSLIFQWMIFSCSYSQNITAIKLLSSDVVVISPKNSGVKRARSLVNILMLYRHYRLPSDDAARNEGYIIGDVGGKAILIDDILNTGRTFSRLLKSLNVKELQKFMLFLCSLFVEGCWAS